MSTTISVLGGVGPFLLGMSVMTSGLKALAGSRLRAPLSKAAATAGLLTFAQGLGLVFGANIGTTESPLETRMPGRCVGDRLIDHRAVNAPRTGWATTLTVAPIG
jgi:hypothetical protein